MTVPPLLQAASWAPELLTAQSWGAHKPVTCSKPLAHCRVTALVSAVVSKLIGQDICMFVWV